MHSSDSRRGISFLQEPMDLSTIEQKLDDSKYKSLSEVRTVIVC